MTKTYSFGNLGKPRDTINKMPFVGPSEGFKEFVEKVNSLKETIHRSMFLPAHVLRGESRPIIEGEFVEIEQGLIGDA